MASLRYAMSKDNCCLKLYSLEDLKELFAESALRDIVNHILDGGSSKTTARILGHVLIGG